MIGKVLFWNIRSIKSQKSFKRLMDLNRRNHYSFIAIMEPFQADQEIEMYKMRLGFHNAYCSNSSKIWLFWGEKWESQEIRDSRQQVTIRFLYNQRQFSISAVYARCLAIERLERWEELQDIGSTIREPWLVEGGTLMSSCLRKRNKGVCNSHMLRHRTLRAVYLAVL